MSEKQTQEFIQARLRELAVFADEDVVIDDWRPLDGSTVNLPYANIRTAGSFRQRQDTPSGVKTEWSIPVIVFVWFDDWHVSLPAMRDLRQAILDLFRDDNRAIQPGKHHYVSEINGSEIASVFHPDTKADQRAEAMPLFLAQELTFLVEEYDR